MANTHNMGNTFQAYMYVDSMLNLPFFFLPTVLKKHYILK